MKAFKRLIGRSDAVERGVPASAAMNDLQRYFIDGFVEQRTAAGPVAARLRQILGDLRAGNVREPFRFEQKYPHTLDLRPQAVDYDASILDLLFENDVPALIARAMGHDLLLAHVQLRIVFPGASYMDWHRDTHMYNGQVSGSIPPMAKLIYYPALGGPEDVRLRLVAGSHRRVMADEKQDLAQATHASTTTICASDDRLVLFDTSLLHAVAPETDDRGSLRVIYTFGRDFQLEPFRAAGEALHALYRQRAGIS